MERINQDVNLSIVAHCFESMRDLASEAMEMCEQGKQADLDKVFNHVEWITDYLKEAEKYIYKLEEETAISQEEVDVIMNEKKKTSKQAYVDELNKVYDDFIEYSHQEDMRKTFNQGQGDD